MKGLITVIFTAVSFLTSAQINMLDSTAQVIAYWSIGDKESYSISLQKIKLHGGDTTSNETITYDVDITVVDSTENSYLIEWYYHNYKTNSTNEIAQKVTSISEELKVIIETDELGIIVGVKNWDQVSEYIKSSIEKIRTSFEAQPQLDAMFKQIEGMYTSKAGIEAMAIQDAQQFHTFHGAKYLLGEVLELQMQSANLYDPIHPFNTTVHVYLDELIPEENNLIIRSSHEIDSEQLTNTTLEYLKSISKSTGAPEIKKEDIDLLSNVTNTASRIHESGWVIYSVQTKTIEASGAMNIEERILEIK